MVSVPVRCEVLVFATTA
jgi:hypothetical protein